MQILKRVQGQSFLSQLLGIIPDRSTAFLVLRFEENGSLRTFLNRIQSLPLDVVRNLTIDILLGLDYLHVLNIVHGDLKPDNILLDSNLRAHIGDFGLSLTGGPWYGKWGTPGYQSPEQLSETTPWDHRVDYFIVGIMFVEMFTNEHPFGHDPETIHKNILAMKYKMPEFNCPNAEYFVKKTLCAKENRLTVDTILKHPFIVQHINQAISSYIPHTILHKDTPETPFYDGVNFFEPISGLDYASTIEEGDPSEHDNAETNNPMIICGDNDQHYSNPDQNLQMENVLEEVMNNKPLSPNPDQNLQMENVLEEVMNNKPLSPNPDQNLQTENVLEEVMNNKPLSPNPDLSFQIEDALEILINEQMPLDFPKNDGILMQLSQKLANYIEKTPSANGSQVLVITYQVEYRFLCGICEGTFKAVGQKRKETNKTNWTIQTFTRHFDRVHLKLPFQTKKRPRMSKC